MNQSEHFAHKIDTEMTPTWCTTCDEEVAVLSVKPEPDTPDDVLVEKSDVPRWVLSITDTHTIQEGPAGDQYFQINIAADKINDFNRLLPKKMRTNSVRTEYQAMMDFAKKQTDLMHADQVETRPLSEPEK